MQSRSYESGPSFQPWVLMTVGVLIGRQSSIQWAVALDQFYWFVEYVLVPVYTAFVFTYLSALVIQRYILPRIAAIALRIPSADRSKQEEELEADDAALDQGDDSVQPINMTGKYKLVSVDNFDKFLEVQGVPWPLRRAACRARPVHRITHRGNRVTIRIEGLIVTQTTYVINGPPVEISIRGRKFKDQMKYLEDGTGIRGVKKAITENYDVIVDRVLSEDKQKITLTGRAIFNDDREAVESVQIFERVQ